MPTRPGRVCLHRNIRDGMPHQVGASKTDPCATTGEARVERPRNDITTVLRGGREASKCISDLREKVSPDVAVRDATEPVVCHSYSDLDDLIVEPNNLDVQSLVQMRSGST